MQTQLEEAEATHLLWFCGWSYQEGGILMGRGVFGLVVSTISKRFSEIA